MTRANILYAPVELIGIRIDHLDQLPFDIGLVSVKLKTLGKDSVPITSTFLILFAEPKLLAGSIYQNCIRCYCRLWHRSIILTDNCPWLVFSLLKADKEDIATQEFETARITIIVIVLIIIIKTTSIFRKVKTGLVVLVKSSNIIKDIC